MKLITALAATLVFVSCSKTDVPNNPTTEKDSPVAGSTVNSNASASSAAAKAANLQKAKKLLLPANSTQTITEMTVLNKATGQQTTAYIVSSFDNTAASVAPPGGGFTITSGWILHNDGCFYHGTIYTGNNGVSLFVEDPNPYTDEYIGNEPRCGNTNIA